MPFRFAWVLLQLAMIFFMAGCGTFSAKKTVATGAAAEKIPPVETPEQLEQRAETHTHYLMGLSYDQNQEPVKALAEYEKALEGDPGNGDLAAELSRRYLLRKEYDRARASR